MLSSPQSPYFTPALKPQLDFPLKKTSQNKSGASLRVGMERKKEDEVGKEEQEEDVGLSPSHARVSCSCLLGQSLPVSPSSSTPHLLHPAQEAYSVRHIDRVSGEAATGTRIT